jgi:hypothetical protein
MNAPEKVSSCAVTKLRTEVHVKILPAHMSATVMSVTTKNKKQMKTAMIMMNAREPSTDATSKPIARILPVHGSVTVRTDGEVMARSASIKTSVKKELTLVPTLTHIALTKMAILAAHVTTVTRLLTESVRTKMNVRKMLIMIAP